MDFDDFTGRLDYPVYVVTAAAAGERAGCLVGFAGQCSIAPACFMVWLSKVNRTFRVARAADVLAVHLLARDQLALAELFGGRTGDDGVDKFAGVPWTGRRGGTPVLDEAPGWFLGRIEGRTDGGDHVGFLLSPVESGSRTDSGGRPPLDLAPLRLSDAAGISPGHPVH